MDKSGSMPTCPQWTYQRPIKCDKHPHVTNTVPEFVTCGWLPPKATSLSQRVANASGARHGAQPHSMLWRRWLNGFTGDGTMPTRLASLTCPLHWILSYIFPNEELCPWIILTMFFYMKHVPSQADRPAVTRSHCDPGHPLNRHHNSNSHGKNMLPLSLVSAVCWYYTIQWIFPGLQIGVPPK